MQISMTGVQVIDLFFRFAAVGQLGLLMIFLFRTHKVTPFPQLSLITCLLSYILLTAPIENEHYGGLRHVLLLFTDLVPFAVLWYVASLLNPNFTLSNLSKWIAIPTMLWCAAMVYLFLVLGGRSILHDVNHGVGVAVLITAIYICLSEYFDDLDNQRRNTRLLVVVFCSFYMIGLVVFEFVYKAIRDSWPFSLINAIIMFLLIVVICSHVISSSVKGVKSKKVNKDNKPSKELKDLEELMARGVFQQQELTIGRLAEQLGVPAHQLRQIINQELGFSNFSHYLNSYRIPWICNKLSNKDNDNLPILTLALEAGYGSIAPFNRAFKKEMGQTPTQYREQF